MGLLKVKRNVFGGFLCATPGRNHNLEPKCLRKVPRKITPLGNAEAVHDACFLARSSFFLLFPSGRIYLIHISF